MQCLYNNNSHLLEKQILKSKLIDVSKDTILRRLTRAIDSNLPAICYVTAGVLVFIYLPSWSMIPVMIMSNTVVETLTPNIPKDFIGIYIVKNGLMAMIAAAFRLQTVLFYFVQYTLVSIFSPLLNSCKPLSLKNKSS